MSRSPSPRLVPKVAMVLRGLGGGGGGGSSQSVQERVCVSGLLQRGADIDVPIAGSDPSVFVYNRLFSCFPLRQYFSESVTS